MVVALPEPAYDPVAPAAVGGWGLSAALSDHVASFQQQTEVACRVEISLPVRLAKAQETVLYRVAQEALVNVASTPGEPRLGVVAGRQGPGGAGDRRQRRRVRPRPPRRPAGAGPLRPGQHAPAGRDGRRGCPDPLPARPGHTVTATLPMAGAGRAAAAPHRPAPVVSATGGRDGG